MYQEHNDNQRELNNKGTNMLGEQKETIELRPLNFYQQELRKHLPKEIFERTPMRIAYLFLFVAINVGLVWCVMNLSIHWVLKVFVGIIIGQLNAGLAFVAHETLHGSILKNKNLQDVVGFICFAPFLISPTYWRFWHNFLHHGNTQLLIRDPDAFPTLGVYKRSKFMQKMFPLTPGSGHLVSYFYFTYWFSFQAFLNQIYMRFGNKMWEKMDHKRVTVEFSIILVLATSYIYFVGFGNLIYLVMLPFMSQNYGVMSYISTTHNISPLTKINDPLINSLTVTTNPIQDFFHLNFGYHVEHHVFPRMSCHYSKLVHRKLIELFPNEYKHMPKHKALGLLYKTPRIYKTKTELIHPKTQKVYSTL